MIALIVGSLCDSNSSLTIAVRITPGLTVLILAPLAPHALAAACTRSRFAAFETEYAPAGVAAAFYSSSLWSSFSLGAVAKCVVSSADGDAPKRAMLAMHVRAPRTFR